MISLFQSLFQIFSVFISNQQIYHRFKKHIFQVGMYSMSLTTVAMVTGASKSSDWLIYLECGISFGHILCFFMKRLAISLIILSWQTSEERLCVLKYHVAELVQSQCVWVQTDGRLLIMFHDIQKILLPNASPVTLLSLEHNTHSLTQNHTTLSQSGFMQLLTCYWLLESVFVEELDTGFNIVFTRH